MHGTYFIKEHLWMSTSEEAKLNKKKKTFGGIKPSSKLTLSGDSVATVIILKVAKQWRNILHINILKKMLHFQP